MAFFQEGYVTPGAALVSSAPRVDLSMIPEFRFGSRAVILVASKSSRLFPGQETHSETWLICRDGPRANLRVPDRD